MCAKHYSKQFKIAHLILTYMIEVDTIINSTLQHSKMRHTEVK